MDAILQGLKTRSGVPITKQRAEQIFRLQDKERGEVPAHTFLEWAAKQHLGENRGAIAGSVMAGR